MSLAIAKNEDRTCLVWLRNDLRLIDNRALESAADKGFMPHLVFYVTPSLWRRHSLAPIKIDLIRRTLLSLRKKCALDSISFDVVRVDSTNAMVADLLRRANLLKVAAIHFNDEYPLDERKRDKFVEHKLSHAGFNVERFTDRLIVEPGCIKTLQGGTYKVYTPFKRAWIDCISKISSGSLVTKKRSHPKLEGEATVVSETDINFCFDKIEQRDHKVLWPAGEGEAQRRLRVFCKTRLAEYQHTRDFPDVNGTSTLSPYLALGSISSRQCLSAVLKTEGVAHISEVYSEGARCWINELIWREFYSYLAFHHDDLSRGMPFKINTQWLAWRENQQDFERWCKGETGYPIIDAAMRQLRDTGWMHNRLRMVTAMFLTKHLLINWRKGEAYFMQHLIDGDFAANNGGWQWSASTGSDSVPYFRIFNPISQSQRFDAQGAFIARFLPQLAGLDKKNIHDPQGKFGYFKPMVDLKLGRERALEAFKALSQY